MNKNELKRGEELEILFREKTGKQFSYYFNKYREKLKWYLMKICSDEVESEEVADEAFVKAFFEIEKYDMEKSQFSTWLFTIARNIMIHKLKSDSRFESIEKDHDGATIGDFLITDDNSDNEERELIIAKKTELIKNEIANLPEKYANVLIMREIDGLCYEDISQYLELNLNTVKSQIRQGRAMLVKKLEPKFKDLEKMYY
jgi:RNA polymerase sigma-70 factor (ECF subfamily)